MTTFLHVIAWILGGAVMLAAAIALLGVPMIWFEDGKDSRFSHRQLAWLWIADLIFIALVITVAINSGLFHDDNPAHCGAGTRYIAADSDGNWQCVAG